MDGRRLFRPCGVDGDAFDEDRAFIRRRGVIFGVELRNSFHFPLFEGAVKRLEILAASYHHHHFAVLDRDALPHAPLGADIGNQRIARTFRGFR